MSAGAKFIRGQVAAGLAAWDGLDAQVFAARHRALRPRDLPAVVVVTGSERIRDSRALAPGVRLYERILDLQLVIVASTAGQNDDGDQVADQLDDLAEAVETWIFERETWEDVWVEALLARTESGIADEADEPSPMRILTFEVLYHDTAPKPDGGALDPLTRIDVAHDLAPADDEVDARDQILVPQS